MDFLRGTDTLLSDQVILSVSGIWLGLRKYKIDNSRMYRHALCMHGMW